MPVLWAFRHYVDANGDSPVKDTYDGGSAQLRARFQSRIRTLASLPLDQWNENYRKSLKGDCAGLDELRFLADNVQQRPLGFRSGDAEFTLLYWATEKGGRFVPLSACEKALANKSKILRNGKLKHDLWFVLE
ncbi:hypothetical protein [Phenylobacterium sp.]|uniref:hypothetical protein n=1 Tax=Phenylobacterium sp. TaxID=1871053 RepID=UPI00374DB56A